MVNVHRLPVFHEKGGGGGGVGGEDLSFTLRRRGGLVIKPFSLPPVEGEGDQEGEKEGQGLEGDGGGRKVTKKDIEF